MSATATLAIEHAGPLTTIQDRGRPGYGRFGVPPSGPVDRFAFAAALTALKLPQDAAAIELSLGGVTLRCRQGRIDFALAGHAEADLDGVRLGSWTVATLHEGSRLAVRIGPRGRWGYLALAGRLPARTWLGSRSTHLLADVGGARLAAGDTLLVEDAAAGAPAGRLDFGEDEPLGEALVVLGPQDRFLPPAALALLQHGEFRASARFDRMGLALDGPALPPLATDMISEPAIRGALQVDGEGRLVMLLADYQTTSGYPKIATVIDAHVDVLAQLAPGASVRFRAVDAMQAAAAGAEARRTRSERLMAMAAPRTSIEERLATHNLIDGIVTAGPTEPTAPAIARR